MPTVSGKVTPLGNTFAVADAETIKGGFMAFPTNTERDALHSSKLTLGMEVNVRSPAKKFILTQITPSVVWSEIVPVEGEIHDTSLVDNESLGTVLTGLLAAQDLDAWQAVYINSSGSLILAGANSAGSNPSRGLVIADTADGDPATVLIRGIARNNAWNWTPGGSIYLSETDDGALTQTEPSAEGSRIQEVGFAVSADIAEFHFHPGYIIPA